MTTDHNAAGDDVIYRPFIPLLFSWTGGIVAGDLLPGHAAVALWLLPVAFGILVVYTVRNVRCLFPLLFLFWLLGYLSLQPWAAPRLPEGHISHFHDKKLEKITATVTGRPQTIRRRTRLVLTVHAVVHQGVERTARGRIRLTVPAADTGLQSGDRIAFAAKPRFIRNFNNPGGFDYERYMAFKRIHVSAYVRPEQINVQARRTTRGPLRFVAQNRRAIAGFIDAATQTLKNPAPAAAVMKALFIGDKSGISADLRTSFNRCGVGHLLAISGLHVGIVATSGFFAFRWLLAFCGPVIRRGWLKKAAAAMAVFPVLYYGMIAGMSPSTQRAVLMVAFLFLSYVVGKHSDLFNTIAMAAWAILILHPPAFFSISFQLSFAAVTAIVMVVSKIGSQRQAHEGPGAWWAGRITALAIVSLAATFGTLPLVMYYFNQVSLVGVGLNLVAVPLVGCLIVPLGLISIALQLIGVETAALLLGLCAYLVELTLLLIDFFARFSFAAIRTVTPSVFEIICYYGLFYSLISCIPANRDHSNALTSRCGAKRPVAAGLCILLASSGLTADGIYWLHRRFWHKDLRVTVLDVGQGSAALLELPYGRTMVIDGGGFGDRSAFDTGALILAPFLWRRKIGRVDMIVLSHPNSDHLNGLIYIAQHFNVASAWTNGEPADTKGYREFMDVLQKAGIAHPGYAALETGKHINGVDIAVLAPEKNYLDKKTVERWRNTNNNSLVLKVTYGDIAFLFPGDIMAAAEKRLVERMGTVLKSTVLLAPHHGSRTSSTAPFLDAVDPSLVVISVGWRNRYRFPHAAVMRRYRRTGCKVLRTDTDGAVSMCTDGLTLRLRTAAGDVEVIAPPPAKAQATSGGSGPDGFGLQAFSSRSFLR